MIPKINLYFFASPQPLHPSQTWTTTNLPSVSIDLPDSGVSVHQSPVLHHLGHSWLLIPWHVWPAQCAGSQPAHVHPESTEHTQVERPRSQRPRGWVGAWLRDPGPGSSTSALGGLWASSQASIFCVPSFACASFLPSSRKAVVKSLLTMHTPLTASSSQVGGHGGFREDSQCVPL